MIIALSIRKTCMIWVNTKGENEMIYEYILDEKKNFYYVPRASSLCDARERESLFLKYLGESPLIVSPKVWGFLLKEHKIKYLEV